MSTGLKGTAMVLMTDKDSVSITNTAFSVAA
jgi:hypothetical protein